MRACARPSRRKAHTEVARRRPGCPRVRPGPGPGHRSARGLQPAGDTPSPLEGGEVEIKAPQGRLAVASLDMLAHGLPRPPSRLRCGMGVSRRESQARPSSGARTPALEGRGSARPESRTPGSLPRARRRSLNVPERGRVDTACSVPTTGRIRPGKGGRAFLPRLSGPGGWESRPHLPACPGCHHGPVVMGGDGFGHRSRARQPGLSPGSGTTRSLAAQRESGTHRPAPWALSSRPRSPRTKHADTKGSLPLYRCPN